MNAFEYPVVMAHYVENTMPFFLQFMSLENQEGIGEMLRPLCLIALDRKKDPKLIKDEIRLITGESELLTDNFLDIFIRAVRQDEGFVENASYIS